jgi:hypothetical protein
MSCFKTPAKVHKFSRIAKQTSQNIAKTFAFLSSVLFVPIDENANYHQHNHRNNM